MCKVTPLNMWHPNSRNDCCIGVHGAGLTHARLWTVWLVFSASPSAPMSVISLTLSLPRTLRTSHEHHTNTEPDRKESARSCCGERCASQTPNKHGTACHGTSNYKATLQSVREAPSCGWVEVGAGHRIRSAPLPTRTHACTCRVLTASLPGA